MVGVAPPDPLAPAGDDHHAPPQALVARGCFDLDVHRPPHLRHRAVARRPMNAAAPRRESARTAASAHRPRCRCRRLSQSARTGVPAHHMRVRSAFSITPRVHQPVQGDRIWKFCGGSPASLSPGGGARGRRLLSSPPFSSRLPPFRGEAGRGIPHRRAGGRRRVTPGPPSRGEKRGRGGGVPGAVERPPVRSAEPGSTPLPTSPLPGGRREDGGGAPSARRQRRRRGNRRPDSLTPPPFRGRSGGGSRADMRARAARRHASLDRTASTLRAAASRSIFSTSASSWARRSRAASYIWRSL